MINGLVVLVDLSIIEGYRVMGAPIQRVTLYRIQPVSFTVFVSHEIAEPGYNQAEYVNGQ